MVLRLQPRGCWDTQSRPLPSPGTFLPGSGALGGSCVVQDWAGGGCRRGGPSWGCPRPWCGGGNSAGAPGGWRWWREAWGGGTPVWGWENKESGSEPPPHQADSSTEAAQRTSHPVVAGGGGDSFFKGILAETHVRQTQGSRSAWSPWRGSIHTL